MVYALPTPPRDGDLAVVELKDHTHMFKRVYYRKEGIILMPVNPAHEPQLVSGDQICRAMKVWGVRF